MGLMKESILACDICAVRWVQFCYVNVRRGVCVCGVWCLCVCGLCLVCVMCGVCVFVIAQLLYSGHKIFSSSEGDYFKLDHTIRRVK